MNRTPRNIQLLQQIPDSNPFKKTLAPRAFDLGNDLEKDLEALALNRNWSREGRRNEAQKLIRSALRDWRDLQKPLQEYSAKTAAMRAAVKAPSYDPSDILGFLRRQELRAASRALTPGQRAGHMTGPDCSLDFTVREWHQHL